MAKVDLSSLERCDLIFSGKNRTYGTYKMREDSPCRHNMVVILAMVIALIDFSIPALIKMATPKQEEVMTEVTTLSQLEEPGVKQEEMKHAEPAAPPPPTLKSSIKFAAPVVKEDGEVRDEDEAKSQTELAKTKVAISIAGVEGNDEVNGKDIADLKQVVMQTPEEKGEVFDMIEQIPTFPGGTDRLMKYITDHLKYPTIAQGDSVGGRVICQFVVSSDGRVRDAEVAETLGPYYDKEAIHIIASMPKWIPGEQSGKAVSMKYAVPIVFRLR